MKVNEFEVPHIDDCNEHKHSEIKFTFENLLEIKSEK